MNKNFKISSIEANTFDRKSIEVCAKLYTDVFKQPPWNEYWPWESVSLLIYKIINKKCFIGYVAEYENSAVGYILGYPLNTVTLLSRIYYINEFFVDKKYQNLKIGTKLLSTLINNLRNKKITWVLLLTQKDTDAERFYKKMGFKSITSGVSIYKRIIMYYRIKQFEVEE